MVSFEGSASAAHGAAEEAPHVDSEEEDDDYVPLDDDEDAAEDDKYEALAGGEDPDDPDCPKGGKRKNSSARSGNAKKQKPAAGAKILPRKGGICLSDDEDEPAPAAHAEPDAQEEAAEEDKTAGASVHKSGTLAQEEAKPKAKSAMDDMWEEMKRGSSVKKAENVPKKDISSFINGLVSKAGSSSSSAGSKGGKIDVASLFPTSVSKKQTVKVEQKVDFAGQQCKITKEVEVGSKEHEAMTKKKSSKGNLDDLVARLTGKQKSITTLTKTEHDWDGFKKEKGLEDELATYRKNGYLEKMSFLKKTDDHLEGELKEQRQKEREARARAQHAANLGPVP